ncbi:MAG: DUF2029 domain-containing protein [Ignavibacteriae bacterium]|nr:DUF2029 domain-containing protein [Ignavibacteriota bacterium]
MKIFRIVLVILATLVAIVSGWYVVKNYHFSLWSSSNRYTDFEAYYKAGARFNINPDSTYFTPEGTPETGRTYNYPPFAMLYFAPLAKLGYVGAYSVFSILSLVASFVITYIVLRIMKEYFISPSRVQTIFAYILTASFAPVWQDMKHGQVNELVAMCAMIFLWFLLKQKYGIAAFVLFMGFWLKIYSAMLGAFVLPFLFAGSALYTRLKVKTPAWKIILIFILALVVPPIVVSVFVPLNLYGFYFTDFLPRLSGVTNLSGLNQSLYGIVARATNDVGNFASWKFVPVAPWMKIGGMLFTLSVLGIVCKQIWRGSVRKFIVTAYIFMAVIPIISQYGWEYVYVFGLPIVLHVMLKVFSDQTFSRYTVFAVIGLLLFWIPKPSDGFIESTVVSFKPFFYHLFFARWIIASLLFCMAAYGYFKIKDKYNGETSLGGTVTS